MKVSSIILICNKFLNWRKCYSALLSTLLLFSSVITRKMLFSWKILISVFWRIIRFWKPWTRFDSLKIFLSVSISFYIRQKCCGHFILRINPRNFSIFAITLSQKFRHGFLWNLAFAYKYTYGDYYYILVYFAQEVARRFSRFKQWTVLKN